MGNRLNHKPKRPRKLLMHKREIDKFAGKASQQGFTLVPLRLYFKKGRAKVEIGVARGKKLYDKRRGRRRRRKPRSIFAEAMKDSAALIVDCRLTPCPSRGRASWSWRTTNAHHRTGEKPRSRLLPLSHGRIPSASGIAWARGRASAVVEARWFLQLLFTPLHGSIETLIVQRKLFPAWQLKLLRRRVRNLIYDFDDSVFYHNSYRETGGNCPKRAEPFERMVQAADVVIAGNDYLRDRAAASTDSSKIRVIPTCLDIHRYSLAQHADRPHVKLAWIGSASTLRGSEHIRGLLDRLGGATEFAIPGDLRSYVVAGAFAGRIPPMEFVDRSRGSRGCRHRHQLAARRRLERRQVRPQGAAVHGGGAAGHRQPCWSAADAGARRRMRNSAARRTNGCMRLNGSRTTRPCVERWAPPEGCAWRMS